MRLEYLKSNNCVQIIYIKNSYIKLYLLTNDSGNNIITWKNDFDIT